MNESRRGRGSIRVSLAAVLVGAVLAGGATLASRLSGTAHAADAPGPVISATTVIAPAGAELTSTPATTTGPRSTPSSTPATSTTTTPSSTRPTPTSTVPAPTTTVPPTSSTTPPASPAQQVLALVNSARAQAGCAALTEDPRLDQAAQGHSDDMAQQGYFSHTTPDGVTFDQRETAAGYPNPGGENIAEGQTSAQQVMHDWMNSSGHRANILNCDFVAIGIGVNTNGWYWTQDFGR